MARVTVVFKSGALHQFDYVDSDAAKLVSKWKTGVDAGSSEPIYVEAEGNKLNRLALVPSEVVAIFANI
ncbi:MAG: hypothetical protein MRY63_10535 [Neomegalonema sp.]|nr:hypothetical protein [Neomegalonema sp.]